MYTIKYEKCKINNVVQIYYKPTYQEDFNDRFY